MFFNSIPSVSVTEAAQRLQQPNTRLIDVRSAQEYQTGHAKGALSAPPESMDVHALKQYDAVYVLCRSGGRSSAVTKALISQGVKAVNVSGGTMTWQANGLSMSR